MDANKIVTFTATADVVTPGAFELTVNVTGLPDTVELAFDNVVWVGNKKSFNEGDLILNLTPQADGYTFTPSSIGLVTMDSSKTVNFAASVVVVPSDLIAGNSRITTLPAPFTLDNTTKKYTSNNVTSEITSLNLQFNTNSLFGFIADNTAIEWGMFITETSNTNLKNKGFYVYTGSELKAEWSPDGVDYQNTLVDTYTVGVFYGLGLGADGVIRIVKSTDMINYTILHTYPNDGNYRYINYYNANAPLILRSVQGQNLTIL